MKIQNSHKSGFTLVEILLYLGISTVIISTASFFIISMLQTQARNRVASQVETQGVQVLQQITQAVRNARQINTPAAGVTATSLSVQTVTPATNPTVFNLNNGILQLTAGAGAATALHSNTVTASNVQFINLSRASTPGSVKMQFTLTYNNPSGRQEYNYSKTFYATASIR
ncbi:MAG: type II secretion system protein J [Weeksellaceae bacterium]